MVVEWRTNSRCQAGKRIAGLGARRLAQTLPTRPRSWHIGRRVIHRLRGTAMRLAGVLLAALLLVGLGLPPANAEKRLALVIGNDDYRNVTKLRKAVGDARALGRTLSG